MSLEPIRMAAHEAQTGEAARRRWTMAEVRGESLAAGGLFFAPKTMRFWGDTLDSFAIREVDADGCVVFERVRPWRERSGDRGVGKRYRFCPSTARAMPWPCAWAASCPAPP